MEEATQKPAPTTGDVLRELARELEDQAVTSCERITIEQSTPHEYMVRVYARADQQEYDGIIVQL